MLIRKAFKFRIYPNVEQQEKLSVQFGCARFVYNYYRRVREEYYHETGSGLTYNDCATDLADVLKLDYPWLTQSDSQVLQQSLKDLDAAYQNFFKGLTDYPKFKRKHGKQSVRYPQRFKFSDKQIYLPKVGWVKCVYHRATMGTAKNVTVSRTKTGKFFASIQCEYETIEPTQKDNSVGIDLGLKHFAVLSDGTKIDNPKCLKKSERRLKIRQRRLSRTKKGSSGRNKQRQRVALIHEKVANQRKDFHHQLSNNIVKRYGSIGMETLNVSGMVKNHHLSKSISDVGWSQFVQFVTYKAVWCGAKIVRHDRFFASSKTCSDCGAINQSLVLSDRSWVCVSCGVTHDRDINAAINLKPKLLRESQKVTPMEIRVAVTRSATEAQRL